MTASRRLSRHEIYYLYSTLSSGVIIKKGHPLTVDKYSHQCGFLHHIHRTTKAHEQTIQSVYVPFWLFENLFERFPTINATNPPFTSGLSVKGDREASSLPFMTSKGVRNYETIFFSDHDRESV